MICILIKLQKGRNNYDDSDNSIRRENRLISSATTLCHVHTKKYGEHSEDIRQHIAINFQTEVIDAEAVRRQANVWLLTYVGNLLGAENPELLLDNPLQWRFDIRLTLPDADMSHPFVTGLIGKICFNALTGESMVQAGQIDDFINELQSYAEKLVTH